MGTEVISVDLEQYEENPKLKERKYVYYIKDHTQTVAKDMTWSDTNGRSIIYYPGHNPKTIYLKKETKGKEVYFIVGCFKGSDFSNFQTVGKVTCDQPTSTAVCDNQVPCSSTEAEIQPNESYYESNGEEVYDEEG